MANIYTIHETDYKFESDFSRDPEEVFLEAVNRANPDLPNGPIKSTDITLGSVVEVADNAIYNSKITITGKASGRYTDSVDIYYNRIAVSDVLLALNSTSDPQFEIKDMGGDDAFHVKAIDPYDIYAFNNGNTPKYSDLLEYLRRYYFFNIGKITTSISTEISATGNDTDVVSIALAPDNLIFNSSGGSESKAEYSSNVYFDNWEEKN